ncbi:MAG: CpsB/CapC family capsule biosynthesis tyrosine phosphatase [Blautia sp.]
MPDKGLFDIHCHIVPSVDDGASSAEEAYKMLQMEYRQGVRNIIATPHYRLQV